MKRRYDRKNEHYKPEEILPYVRFTSNRHCPYGKEFDGDFIKLSSQRYQCFARNGLKCVSCGIEGQYFIKERIPGDPLYHFNLYAIDDKGNEVLMTKDHIIPKSKGGRDKLENYQTMCAPCNIEKGDQLC